MLPAAPIRLPVPSEEPAPLRRGNLDGAKCGECPLAKDGKPHNAVVAVGPDDPLWIAVGEGPGGEEIRTGLPFVGPTGQLLNRALKDTAVNRSRLWVTNSTACHPRGADEKTRKVAAQCCRPRLVKELAEFPGVPMLTMGAVASLTVLDEATTLKITQITGTYFEIDFDGTGRRGVIPTIHPASILRNSHDGDTGSEKTGAHTADLAYWGLKFDIIKVNRLAKGDAGVKLVLDIRTELVDADRANVLVNELLDLAEETSRIAVDYETYVEDDVRNFALQAWAARIRLVGLASKGTSVSVLWDLLTRATVRRYAGVLANTVIAKEFHNAAYDTAVSRNPFYRFLVRGPLEDTLLGQHAAWPGAKKDLQSTACQMLAIPPWKCLRGDVKVLLPDRSTMEISEAVRNQIPEVLSFDGSQIVTKRVLGWHNVHVPNQTWLRINTDRCDSKYSRGLIVTPDHKVMTDRGLVEARHLRVGEDRVLIDEPRFSDDQIAVALGTLLGDSNLNVSRSYHQRPWEAKRASVRGGHANEGLRDCKVAALPLGTAGQRLPAHIKHTKTGTQYQAADFYAYGTTWAFQYHALADLTYDRQWKRRIKPEALSRLGPRGLAMLFMDDGDLHRSSRSAAHRPTAGFAVQGFPLEDIQIFAGWLRARYGAASVWKSRHCALSTVATMNMLEDLRGYIHPSVQYKTVFDDPYKEVVRGRGAFSVPVTAVTQVLCDRATGKSRYLNDHRYCLTVEDTKLFYTNYGLVSNSEFRDKRDSLEDEARYNATDALATHATVPINTFWVKKYDAGRVYNVDRVKAYVAAEMHLRGYQVDYDVNAEIKQRLSGAIDAAKGMMLERYAEVRDRVHARLASERAKTERKADIAGNLNYSQRMEVRLAELQKEIDKGKFTFDPSNDNHAVAFMKAIGVKLWRTTEGGKTASGGSVLEEFAHVPEVAELMLLRSNEQLLETFAIRMFEWVPDGDKKNKWRPPHVQDDGRCHPIWSPTQISGRFGSKTPASSNWSLGDETHPDPRKRLPNLRRQLVAARGKIIVAFDYEQLEARLIAVQSGDEFLCKVFAEGKDIHHEFGVLVFPEMNRISREDVNFKDNPEYNKRRDLTKRFEYGGIYGGADGTVWKSIVVEEPSITLKMTSTAIATMKKAIPGVTRWQQRLLRETSLPPFTLKSYLLGRRRVFPLGNPPATDVNNNPNQFAGADIIDIGLCKMVERLEKYRGTAYPILHQHDAIYFECDEADGPKLAKDIVEAFSTTVRAVNGQDIDFPVEVKMGYAYHPEPKPSMIAKFPWLVWPVGRPGLKKWKV